MKHVNDHPNSMYLSWLCDKYKAVDSRYSHIISMVVT